MRGSARISRFRRAAVEFLEAEMAVFCAEKLEEPLARRFLVAAKRLLEDRITWEEVFLAGPAFDLPDEVREREDFDDLLERARLAVMAPYRPEGSPAPFGFLPLVPPSAGPTRPERTMEA